MLEEKLTGLEKAKAVGRRMSRMAAYSAGLIFSFGALAQGKCDYAAQRYAVDGAKAVIAATALYAASCGGEDDEECNDDRDCFDRCIDYALERSCMSSNYTSAEREQCREEEIRKCTERYSSGDLNCGRRCGERLVSDCDHDNPNCGQERMEAYCENACLNREGN